MSTTFDAESIDYEGIETVGTNLRTYDLNTQALCTAVEDALSLSETRGYRLARGIFETAESADQLIAETEALVGWGNTVGSQAQQTVALTIRVSGGDLFLVHYLSGMPRQDDRPFMTEYLNSGGDLRPAVEWLQIAGERLREAGKDDGTAGGMPAARRRPNPRSLPRPRPGQHPERLPGSPVAAHRHRPPPPADRRVCRARLRDTRSRSRPADRKTVRCNRSSGRDARRHPVGRSDGRRCPLPPIRRVARAR